LPSLYPSFLLSCIYFLLCNKISANYYVGVSKGTVALVLIAGGVMEMISRPLNGWIADRRIMTAVHQYALCTFIASVACILCAIISGLPGELFWHGVSY